MLSLVSVLFLVIAVYAVGFLRHESPRGGRVFVTGLLGFLAAATLVSVSHLLALLWVGMETTTLTLAPLVYHRHDRRSLEAVWKYLLLSSVGIALALLGTFFLAAAQTWGHPLLLEDLIAGATSLHPSLLRTAFIFLLVGYGTKMGLAPLHAWKPDTYGEAPSLVAGLMAGGLTSCAFLGRRAHHRDHDRRRAGDVRAAATARLRPGLAGRRGGLHDRAGRPQAAARLLQRRAHGAAGAGPRPRRRGALRHRAAPGQQRA